MLNFAPSIVYIEILFQNLEFLVVRGRESEKRERAKERVCVCVRLWETAWVRHFQWNHRTTHRILVQAAFELALEAGFKLRLLFLRLSTTFIFAACDKFHFVKKLVYLIICFACFNYFYRMLWVLCLNKNCLNAFNNRLEREITQDLFFLVKIVSIKWIEEQIDGWTDYVQSPSSRHN